MASFDVIIDNRPQMTDTVSTLASDRMFDPIVFRRPPPKAHSDDRPLSMASGKTSHEAIAVESKMRPTAAAARDIKTV